MIRPRKGFLEDPGASFPATQSWLAKAGGFQAFPERSGFPKETVQRRVAWRPSWQLSPRSSARGALRLTPAYVSLVPFAAGPRWLGHWWRLPRKVAGSVRQGASASSTATWKGPTTGELTRGCCPHLPINHPQGRRRGVSCMRPVSSHASFRPPACGTP